MRRGLGGEQLELTQDMLKKVMKDSDSSEAMRTEARLQFLAASRAVLAVAEKKKKVAELRLFRDVEEKQGDSKLFWGKFRKVRNSIVVNKSPPPVAVNSKGVTVTDPIEVLKAWRDFSAAIASTDLSGTKEEGIYDDEYKDEVEAHLEWLRHVRVHQPAPLSLERCLPPSGSSEWALHPGRTASCPTSSRPQPMPLTTASCGGATRWWMA